MSRRVTDDSICGASWRWDQNVERRDLPHRQTHICSLDGLYYSTSGATRWPCLAPHLTASADACGGASPEDPASAAWSAVQAVGHLDCGKPSDDGGAS